MRQICKLKDKFYQTIFHDGYDTLPATGHEPNMIQCRQARTMKINNPPLPPFSKGGLGGFGKLFSRQLSLNAASVVISTFLPVIVTFQSYLRVDTSRGKKVPLFQLFFPRSFN